MTFLSFYNLKYIAIRFIYLIINAVENILDVLTFFLLNKYVKKLNNCILHLNILYCAIFLKLHYKIIPQLNLD